MGYSKDERALLWLVACSGLELKSRDRLYEIAPSPEELFRNFEKYLPEVILKGKTSVYKESSLSVREAELERILAYMDRIGCFAVTIASEDYPSQLRHINLPPLVLFGKGNRALLQERLFCIVGSRRTPPWAESHGRTISEEISESFAIVTGIAEGGDAAAIKGALSRGKVISVLPCGIDECFPTVHVSLKEEIARKGLILSECPFKEKVRKGSFHARNRILAGLSEGVLVLSAGTKSGALITANYAIENNRDVFAFPYSLGVSQGEGCNDLIKNGAFLCTEAGDILLNYGFSPKGKVAIELSDEEILVLGALAEGELHTAAIAERVGMLVYEASAVLSALEMSGLVVKVGGNRYKAI